MNRNKILIGLMGTVLTGIGAGLGIAIIGERHIYNKEGFNKLGFDRSGYNQFGFDKKGFDRMGFDKNGYDQNGFDKDGFNSKGFDKKGYDREGYNVKGYSKKGYDRNGRDRKGFDIFGFDVNGYDGEGYDADGYNSMNLDRSGKGESYYIEKFSEINDLAKKAHIQMKQGNFSYALSDIRIGLEKAVKCIIEHKKGSGYCSNNLFKNLEVCSKYNLLTDDFVQSLHSAKNHCNDTQHDSRAEAKSFDQVFFAYKVLKETADKIEELCYSHRSDREHGTR